MTKCTPPNTTRRAPPANKGTLTTCPPTRDDMGLTTLSPAAAQTTRTEQFECVECGHRFNRRTKAGIHTNCPKCRGVAVGGPLKDRILAGASTRLAAIAAGKVKRSHHRKAALQDQNSAPAPDVHGGNSDPPSEAQNGVTIPPQTARRRAAPVIEPMPAAKPPRRPATATSSPPAPVTVTSEPPRRPGVWSRILGSAD